MVGHQPATLQTIRLSATKEGRLIAIDHQSVSPTTMTDDYIEYAVQRPVAESQPVTRSYASIGIRRPRCGRRIAHAVRNTDRHEADHEDRQRTVEMNGSGAMRYQKRIPIPIKMLGTGDRHRREQIEKPRPANLRLDRDVRDDRREQRRDHPRCDRDDRAVPERLGNERVAPYRGVVRERDFMQRLDRRALRSPGATTTTRTPRAAARPR